MTIKQLLKHLVAWLRMCPAWDRDPHCYVGLAGFDRAACLVCGHEWRCSDDYEADSDNA